MITKASLDNIVLPVICMDNGVKCVQLHATKWDFGTWIDVRKFVKHEEQWLAMKKGVSLEVNQWIRTIPDLITFVIRVADISGIATADFEVKIAERLKNHNEKPFDNIT